MSRSNNLTPVYFCFISYPIYFWLDMNNLICSRAKHSSFALEKENLCDFFFFIGTLGLDIPAFPEQKEFNIYFNVKLTGSPFWGPESTTNEKIFNKK